MYLYVDTLIIRVRSLKSVNKQKTILPELPSESRGILGHDLPEVRFVLRNLSSNYEKHFRSQTQNRINVKSPANTGRADVAVTG